MSELSERTRAAAKEKVKRLTSGGKEPVDASDYGEAPCGFMHNDRKLGNRPISKQNLASGGKAAHKHAGRKSRGMGGAMPTAGMPPAAGGQPMVANVPLPPQNRFSFTGNQSPFLAAAGMKKGGKAKRAEGGGNWIKGAIKHPGALHKELGVPEGKKIPAKKLKKAEHSSNPLERKRADLAKTLKGMHKKADGGPVDDPNEGKYGIWGESNSRPNSGGFVRPSSLNGLKSSEAKEIAQRYNKAYPNQTFTHKPYNNPNVTKRADGGGVHEKGAQNPEIIGDRPKGGRIPRKDGGSAGKGKMNVNIIIAQKPEHPMMGGGAPGVMPPKAPMPIPGAPGAMPPPPPGGPGGAPAGPMPGGPNMPPPSMQPPMGRAGGGKVYPDMRYASGGGEGRLEKIKKYGGA